MLDGTPTLRMNEFMLAGIEKGQIPLELPEGEKATSRMPQPEEVVFEMDHNLKSAVAKSVHGFGQEMSQQDLKVSSRPRSPVPLARDEGLSTKGTDVLMPVR